MQCRLNQEEYLRKYSVKKHKEKPDRVYLAYKKADNNHIEKEKRKVANDYLTQTILCFKLKHINCGSKINCKDTVKNKQKKERTLWKKILGILKLNFGHG